MDIINDLTPNNKETKIYKAKLRKNKREKKQTVVTDLQFQDHNVAGEMTSKW